MSIRINASIFSCVSHLILLLTWPFLLCSGYLIRVRTKSSAGFILPFQWYPLINLFAFLHRTHTHTQTLFIQKNNFFSVWLSYSWKHTRTHLHWMNNVPHKNCSKIFRKNVLNNLMSGILTPSAAVAAAVAVFDYDDVGWADYLEWCSVLVVIQWGWFLQWMKLLMKCQKIART